MRLESRVHFFFRFISLTIIVYRHYAATYIANTKRMEARAATRFNISFVVCKVRSQFVRQGAKESNTTGQQQMVPWSYGEERKSRRDIDD
jgi:hypothetical protein